MEDIVNNNIKLIMLDLVGVLVFERDDVLNDKEDKIREALKNPVNYDIGAQSHRGIL